MIGDMLRFSIGAVTVVVLSSAILVGIWFICWCCDVLRSGPDGDKS